MKRAAARLVAAAILLGVPARPAAAHAEDELGLSWDGRTWSSSLQGGLLDSGFRWVPGDSRVWSFHARNRAAERGRLAIEAAVRDPRGLLAPERLVLSARVGEGRWRPLRGTPGLGRVAETSLRPGQAARVDVRAVLDAATTNRSQRDALELDLRVTLAAGEAESRPQAGTLPAAGSPTAPWWPALGAVLLGCGLALVRRGRRQGETHVAS